MKNIGEWCVVASGGTSPNGAARRRPGPLATTYYAPRICSCSVQPEVSLQLPLTDAPDVLLPLPLLRLDEPLVDVVAEGGPDNLVLLEVLERLVQVPGEVVDAEVAPLAVAHLEDVLVDRVGRRELMLDAIQAGGDLHGEREVGIGRGVGHAHLAARAYLAALGDADQRRAVAHRPGDVHRRLVARHQALVAVDQRIGNGAKAAGVLQQSPDVLEGDLGQLPLRLPFVERVLPLPEQ